MPNQFEKFLDPNHLDSFSDAAEAFQKIADGEIKTSDIETFLRKINSYEMVNNLEYFHYFNAAACVFRDKMVKINSPEKTIDVCGTGGDGLKTLNVSTAVSFIVATCGVAVAKHGNRAVSSSSGSSDIFQKLGVDINLSKEKAEECLFKNNLVFLFAPLYHPAFKNVAEARKNLGVKTIFNYLGPLLNPAQPKYQLIGCSNAKIAPWMSIIAADNNCKNSIVVYGEDGMDEISVSSNSKLVNKKGEVRDFNPENFGFKKVAISEIQGKDINHNAQKLLELLEGKSKNSSYYNIVVLNAALALYITKEDFEFGNFNNLYRESIEQAKAAIDSGAALEVLKKLQNFK